MKIKVTTLYVDNQENALQFYTGKLGMVKKADFSNGPYRWLTVAPSEDPDGTELQLALSDSPHAAAYQKATFEHNSPAFMFFTDNVAADYDRLDASGVEFTMPPTQVPGATIAMLKDTCGNLIQISQLAKW